MLDLVAQVAPTKMPILIYGESGTGKEIVARSVHHGCLDSRLPFLAVNTAALPDTLLESELFGHVKGAFTGATRDRQGIFAMARGGTIFLDEIASMSPAFQGKLLRVLQERTIIPLGSSSPRQVDFRLVAASNRRLLDLVDAGEFREDLYYRLRVVSIDIPPLRERPADILPLVEHFLACYTGDAGLVRCPRLTAGAIHALFRHSWPGNVRELENCVQRALVLSRGREIDSEHLGLDGEGRACPGHPAEMLSYEEGKKRALRAYQRATVERALRETNGNVSRAAARCGITRATLQRIMRSLDVDRHEFIR
ncbi:MAG: sigma 54-interacting transcriptional regulator [Holophagales bacterium]|nr:sigma 54-interacting transcriptional regulator [Holophagales bacterium]